MPFKKLLLSALLLLSIFLFPTENFSQNKGKYPALLWEISGNGLSKPSYLYGTMHVSNKLAFHLSDSFFVALKNADIIALETNPEEWLQNMKDMGFFDMGEGRGMYNPYYYGGGGGDFYKNSFTFDVPSNREIGTVLSSDPDLVNGLLYRSYESTGNHEENTYLDLFIFQCAKKMDKQVTPLEDFKESEKMIEEAVIPDPEEEEEVQKYYKGMYESRYGLFEKIEDAYRIGDLDALDSLSRLTYPSKKYEKYMLHLRNEVMVRGMDSIMKKQVLFTGVGAAHLPGPKGVIEMLREKGYSVRPMTFHVSKKSMKEKDRIEKTVKALSYATQFAPDSVFKCDIPGKLIETNKTGETRHYLCPEMINGAYFLVSRIKTYAAFNGQDQAYIMKRLDSLFYERIPGKILKNSKIIANNGWPGYDITNQTRKGDFQRYKIFVGPQEVFIFKLGGNGQFAKGSDGEKFFNSISFSDAKKTGWAKFSPPTGGFSAELPTTVMYENSENTSGIGPAEKAEAIDPSSGDFYFAMRSIYNDFNYIEEDTFELNLFLKRYTEDTDLEVQEKTPGMFGKYPMLSAKLKNKSTGENIFLKFYLKGSSYYLLGAKMRNNAYPERFFNSFAFEEFKFNGTFKEEKDTTLHFTVNTESTEDKESFMNSLIRRAGAYSRGKKGKKKFDTSYLSSFQSKNAYSPSSSESIRVEYRKFNNYRMVKSKEEFWKNEIQNMTRENGLIVKNKKVTNENGIEQIDMLLTDTASTRGIKTRLILKNGVLYTLQATIDTLSSMSLWMDTYFKTFHPTDSVIGKSPFDDKVNIFLEDLASKDSSKKNAATNSTYEPEFNKEHLAMLLPFMEAPTFRAYSLDVRTSMIWNLSSIKDDKVIAYLQKQYHAYADTASMQFSLLSALARQQKEAATKHFLELLKTETPLTNSNYDIQRVFMPYYDSLEMAPPLFPGLLGLTKFAEYKPSIYSLLAELVSKDLLKSPAYADQKGTLLNEAMYELKRFKANDVSSSGGSYNSSYSSDYDYNSGAEQEEMQRMMEQMLAGAGSKYGSSSSYNDDYSSGEFSRSELENYAILLVPFYAEPQTKVFFDKLSENKSLMMQTNLLLLKNKLPTNDTLWNFYAKDEKTRLPLYRKLEGIKMTDKFPDQYKTQENFVRSLLYGSEDDYSNYNYGDDDDTKEEKKKDSIIFICKKLVKNKNSEGYVYFFKRKKGDKKEWTLDYSGFQPVDEKAVATRSRYQRRGLVLFEDKTIEEQIDEIVAELQLRGRARVNNNDYGYDYASDYIDEY